MRQLDAIVRRPPRRTHTYLTFLITLVMVLLCSASATAQTASQDGYGGTGTTVVQQADPSLPFTGLNLGVLSLVAILILCAGIAMRRLSNRPG